MSQKGDSHAGRSKLSCEKGSVPKRATSNQDKYFALLGFATLAGEPIVCCAILLVVLQNPIVETGIDFTNEWVGDVE